MNSERTAHLAFRARFRENAIHAWVRAWARLVSPIATRLFHHSLIFRTGNFASVRWAGSPVWQSIIDLWTIQETIAEIRPALLIETGTHKGGSALFYAHLMDALDHGRVITIYVDDAAEVTHPRIRFLTGSSTAPEIVEEVQDVAAAAEGPVMVILDSDHDRKHVARELEIYAPLVTPGSLLLSQDGIIDRFWFFRNSRPGPLGANREFLDRHPEFEHDRERNERYLLSHHPLGWMRRRAG